VSPRVWPGKDPRRPEALREEPRWEIALRGERAEGLPGG
jgi:hypothetical protein